MHIVGKIETYQNLINLYNHFVESADPHFCVKNNKVILQTV